MEIKLDESKASDRMLIAMTPRWYVALLQKSPWLALLLIAGAAMLATLGADYVNAKRWQAFEEANAQHPYIGNESPKTEK